MQNDSYAWTSVVWTLFRRELSERLADSYATLWSMLLPVVLAIAAALALGAPGDVLQAASGVWFLVYLASQAPLDTLMGREQQQNTYFSLLWSDPFAVFAAKAAASMLMLTVLEMCILPVLFGAWFEGIRVAIVPLILLTACVNFYLSVVMVFLGVLSVSAQSRTTVFMLMAIPLVLPALLYAGKSLGELLLGQPVTGAAITMLALALLIATFAHGVLKEVWWL